MARIKGFFLIKQLILSLKLLDETFNKQERLNKKFFKIQKKQKNANNI